MKTSMMNRKVQTVCKDVREHLMNIINYEKRKLLFDKKRD